MKNNNNLFYLIIAITISACSLSDVNLTQNSGTYICSKCNPPLSLHFIDDKSLEIIDMSSNKSILYSYTKEGQGIIIKDINTKRIVQKMYFIGRTGKKGRISAWDLTGGSKTFTKTN